MRVYHALQPLDVGTAQAVTLSGAAVVTSGTPSLEQ
jgi:hypothetical protein